MGSGQDNDDWQLQSTVDALTHRLERAEAVRNDVRTQLAGQMMAALVGSAGFQACEHDAEGLARVAIYCVNALTDELAKEPK